MKLLDAKFRGNKGRYIAQCTLASMVVFVILHVLDAAENAALVGSLGASAFIVFAVPQAESSRPRFLLGGYFVGICCAAVCYGLCLLSVHAPFIHQPSAPLFAAVSVGMTIFIMVMTDTEHPPAAGVALGLVLNMNLGSLLVVVLGILCLSAIRALLKPMLINLV
ncbi:MAG: HPP family protein [bacterium]|nr:HPP family protein [bacterium]